MWPRLKESLSCATITSLTCYMYVNVVYVLMYIDVNSTATICLCVCVGGGRGRDGEIPEFCTHPRVSLSSLPVGIKSHSGVIVELVGLHHFLAYRSIISQLSMSVSGRSRGGSRVSTEPPLLKLHSLTATQN